MQNRNSTHITVKSRHEVYNSDVTHLITEESRDGRAKQESINADRRVDIPLIFCRPNDRDEPASQSCGSWSTRDSRRSSISRFRSIFVSFASREQSYCRQTIPRTEYDWRRAASGWHSLVIIRRKSREGFYKMVHARASILRSMAVPARLGNLSVPYPPEVARGCHTHPRDQLVGADTTLFRGARLYRHQLH